MLTATDYGWYMLWDVLGLIKW